MIVKAIVGKLNTFPTLKPFSKKSIQTTHHGMYIQPFKVPKPK